MNWKENYGSIATVRVVARADQALAPQNNVRLLKALSKVKKKQGMIKTLSQNGRFSTKKSGQFRGPTKDALLHSHVNRVTFSLTSTLPMANSGCLCPVIVAGWRAGRLGVVK